MTPVNNPAQFVGYSKLYNIGVDGCYNLLVTDLYGQLVHKFSYTGKYSCSYNKNIEFTNPYFASNVVDNCDYNSHALHYYIGSAWGRSNGIIEYLSGADIINLQNINCNEYYKFTFFATDEMYCTVKLIKTSNNQTIHSWNNVLVLTSTNPIFTHTQDGSMPNGQYKWQVTFIPRYNQYYGQYQVSPRTLEIVFNHTNYAPVFNPTNPFTQYPNQYCKGSSGSLHANLSQGNGVLQWNWVGAPPALQYYSYGIDCWFYIPNTSYQMGPDEEVYSLTCTVENLWGTATRSHLINIGCPPSCPTLAFNVGGEMTDDNPLLITSLSNPGVDVTDYYLIQNSVTPIGNKINLRIHEPQTEHTWLDYVELIEAKVKSDELVAVNDEGEIINYKKLSSPVTVLLNGATDITFLLTEMDTLDITLTEGDVLTILRNAQSPGDGEDEDFVIGGIDPIKNHESITLSLAKKDDNNEDNPRIGGIFLRPNKSIMAKKLRNLPPGDIELVINKTLTLDYLTIAKNIKTAKVKSLDLLSANHSTAGDVKTLLSGIDQNYAETIPGDIIDLEFQKGNTPAEKTAYILKSVGRYETDTTLIMNKPTGIAEENLIPRENKLFDNYPNPFNPTTQIKYSVKENGMVTLKVYDVLGNEVATLVNEVKQADTYTVNFNAGSLASGIYFYTISANDFQKTKKMLLIK